MKILFLCRQRDLQREPLGYVRALRSRGVEISFAHDGCPPNEKIERLLNHSPDKPSLIIQPETDLPLLPRGLDRVDLPTACFFFDPYAYLHRRLRWAMLFDYVVLFHPGFEDAFSKAGHMNPMTLWHAVDPEFFTTLPKERPLDVGWVGRSAAPVYRKRKRVLETLATTFRMNDWSRLHSYEELAQVYCASKIVVNVGRDDYPIDVSLRFAEAMAAGALFITLLPSEITQLGFQEGVHFVGVRSETELPESVRYYLGHEPERHRIAEAGREEVLSKHTYYCRAEQLMRIVEQNNGKLFAPARCWPDGRARLVYVDYYSAHARWDYACSELRHIVRSDMRAAAAGGTLVARAFASRVRDQLGSALQWSK